MVVLEDGGSVRANQELPSLLDVDEVDEADEAEAANHQTRPHEE